MTKIKICGLYRKKDIEYVNKYLPDYIGFVFVESKRKVDFEQAKQLKLLLDSKIEAVGVFKDNEIKDIVGLVNNKVIDLIQLHGNESKEYIKELKKMVNIPIIKVYKIVNQDSFNKLNEDVDYYLFDSLVGGSGKVFDWSLLKNIDKPYFMAGGINIDNVDIALKKDCYAIDVSSGVEKNNIKDEIKIKELIRRIKDGNR